MLTDHPAYSYRLAAEIPAFDDAGPVALMDATCGLCAKGAAWIARNDKRCTFKIVPVQSELGQALARHYGMDPDDPLTWLVLVDGRAYGSLDATMLVGNRLGGIWRALSVLRIMPRPMRDWLYRIVARNRYRFMGRTDMCSLPNPEIQRRLLQPTLNPSKVGSSTPITTPPSSN